MVINYTGSLHVGITNSSAEKLKTTFFHILAYCIRNWGACRQSARKIIYRFPIRHKAVKVFIE